MVAIDDIPVIDDTAEQVDIAEKDDTAEAIDIGTKADYAVGFDDALDREKAGIDEIRLAEMAAMTHA